MAYWIKDGERKSLLLLMGDPEQALDLLSGGGDMHERHSLCGFCSHHGVPACPYGGKKKALCDAYLFKEAPLEVVTSTLLDYLHTPPSMQSILDLK